MRTLSGLAPLWKFGEFPQNWLNVDHFSGLGYFFVSILKEYLPNLTMDGA